MSLAQINVWLDVVFTALWFVVAIALSFHFLGNVLAGRARSRFIDWQWPHHDHPPIPFLPRFLHFMHVAAMIALAFSGMYIRFPFFDGGRTPMRYVHYVAMTIVVINLVWRLWYAFFAKQRDYREFGVSKMDIVTAPKVILYYIFVKNSKPHLGKYNVMQKMTYLLFVPLMFVQAITGFMLLTMTVPGLEATPREILVGWIATAVGVSVDYAGWIARMTHYVINWLFIILTTIHAYLSVSEDLPAFLNFFGLQALGFGKGHEDAHHGDDSHGHGSDHGGHETQPALASTDQG